MFYVACSVTYMLFFFLWGVFLPLPLHREENKEKGKCERKQFWSKATNGVGFGVVNTIYIISGPFLPTHIHFFFLVCKCPYTSFVNLQDVKRIRN